MKDVINNFKNM